MTGLLNRRALDEHPQRALEATGSRTVTVVAVDINRLEEVHDTLGHVAGDRLLQSAARALTQAFDRLTGSLVARVGDDEFTVMVSGHDPGQVLQDRPAVPAHVAVRPGAGVCCGAASTVITAGATFTPSDPFAAADRAQCVAKRGRLSSTVLADDFPPVVLGRPSPSRMGEDRLMIDVRRAAQRFATTTDWLTSRHSFSFGPHYDPADVGLSVLVAHNDDVVAPGAGYDTHPHVDTEIVTWVLEGSLVHVDTRGHAGVLHRGVAQRMSAGRGVLHSERNDEPGAAVPTRFVQMWLRPDEPGLEPSYEQRDAGPSTGLVPLVSGIRGLDAAVRIHTSGAVLYVARLGPSAAVVLPDAPHLHVFVARGGVHLEGAGRLDEGDAARFTGEGGPRLTAATDAEVLVWQLP